MTFKRFYYFWLHRAVVRTFWSLVVIAVGYFLGILR